MAFELRTYLTHVRNGWVTACEKHKKNYLRPVSCGASFFEQAVNEYFRLVRPLPVGKGEESPATDAYRARVGTLVRELITEYKAGQLTWDDLYALQAALLPLYSKPELLSQWAEWKNRFYASANQRQIVDYEKLNPTPLNSTSAYELILGSTTYLHGEVSKIETYRPHQELKRNYITFDLLAALWITVALEALAGLVVMIWRSVSHWVGYNTSQLTGFPFFCLVLIFGAFGAAVSSQRRLQQSFDQDSSILNTTRYVGSGVGVKLVPFQGSVFAAVLIFLIYSGLMEVLANSVVPSTTPTAGNAAPATSSTNAIVIPTSAPTASPPATLSTSSTSSATAAATPTTSPAAAVPTRIGEANSASNPASSGSNTISSTGTNNLNVSTTGSNNLLITSTTSITSANSPSNIALTSTATRIIGATTAIVSGSNVTLIPISGQVPTLTRADMFLTGPDSLREYAKMLVFAFLAGFAERLVPDTLDRLTLRPRNQNP